MTGEVERARKGLLVFFAVLIPIAGATETIIVRRGVHVSRAVLILALMWTPALASIVARIAMREGLRDLSFGVGGRRGAGALLVAVAFPLVIGALAYGVAWSTGLAEFQVPDEDPALVLPLWMVPLSGGPAARFAQSVAIHLSIGAASGCVFAAGEEIGWRGFLLPRMIEAKIPAPIPLGALIWAMWHWPLALAMKSAHPLLSVVMFTIVLQPVSLVMARLRFASGSVLPAIVLHAIWNEQLGLVFAGFTVDEGTWLGESGILVFVATVLVSIPIAIAYGKGGTFPASRRLN